MSNANPHVGDLGTRYTLTFRDELCALLTLTGATVLFWYQAPGATVRIEVTATPDADQVANQGQAYYDVTNIDGIHDTAGSWYLQGKATLVSAAVFHSDILTFEVSGNLPLASCD